METNVLARFIKLMALATFVMFTFWVGWQYLAPEESGDYYVREGDIRLSDGLYDQAIAAFDKALAEQPGHRGALMGRAIAFMQSGRPVEAKAELDHLIKYLEKTGTDGDPTGRGVLAAAYANRGILNDRQGRHEQALEDYIQSMKIDFETVEGPGVVDKILYNVDKWSSVKERAVYLHEQFQLPEDQRVLRMPELDAQQRMHKP
jgi:tetratricopeptide (TPR) repeat protein